jgi:hypothetical protein
MIASTPLASLWPQDHAALAHFDHTAHIRLAREYLLALPLPVAVGAFARDLEAMTHRFGASAKFHRTITLAWMLLVADRVLRADRAETWEDFKTEHADLFAKGSPAIQELFAAGTLASARAREQYLVPDRPTPW